MKKFFSILILAALLFVAGQTSPAKADTVPTDSSLQTFEYLFHLYYDHGQLSADRDFQYQYDIIAAEYSPPQITTSSPWRGEIINLTGQVAADFVFDPQGGDSKFLVGKISVKAPYVPDGDKAVFYDAGNKPVLTVSVGASSYCNDNGVCESDHGESSLTCPKDCKASTLPSPPVTTPSAGSSGGSGLLSAIIYSVIGIVLLGGLWWFYKRRRGGGGGNPPAVGAPDINSLPKFKPLVPPPAANPNPTTPPNPGVDRTNPPQGNNPI